MVKKNVLVVGAGNRVQKTILPALFCLKSRLNLVGVYSRSSKTLLLPDGKSTLTTIINLDNLNFAKLDAIIVAVTTQNVPQVLKNLSRFKVSQVVLFLDTPVLQISDVSAGAYFRLFKKVCVSEDFIFMSSFSLVKQLISTGVIGQLRHIYLFHSGYNHHAIAILRYLIGAKFINSVRIKRLNNEVIELHSSFQSGITANVYKPKDYDVGRILIVGISGCIADYPLKSHSVIHLEYLYKNRIYYGVKVSVSGKSQVFDNPSFQKIKYKLQNKSLINCQKIEGLMHLLLDGLQLKQNQHTYSSLDGLYDHLVSAWVNKFGFFRDFKLPFMYHSFFQYILLILINYPRISLRN